MMIEEEPHIHTLPQVPVYRGEGGKFLNRNAHIQKGSYGDNSRSGSRSKSLEVEDMRRWRVAVDDAAGR